MKTKIKTLADFRATFDRSVVIPNKIQNAFAAMLKEGPDSWEVEGDFIKRAGISQTDVSAFREQFERHIIEAREVGRSVKRIWFADAKVAAKARGE